MNICTTVRDKKQSYSWSKQVKFNVQHGWVNEEWVLRRWNLSGYLLTVKFLFNSLKIINKLISRIEIRFQNQCNECDVTWFIFLFQFYHYYEVEWCMYFAVSSSNIVSFEWVYWTYNFTQWCWHHVKCDADLSAK